jgi:hypothetical protein
VGAYVVPGALQRSTGKAVAQFLKNGRSVGAVGDLEDSEIAVPSSGSEDILQVGGPGNAGESLSEWADLSIWFHVVLVVVLRTSAQKAHQYIMAV